MLYFDFAGSESAMRKAEEDHNDQDESDGNEGEGEMETQVEAGSDKQVAAGNDTQVKKGEISQEEKGDGGENSARTEEQARDRRKCPKRPKKLPKSTTPVSNRFYGR